MHIFLSFSFVASYLFSGGVHSSQEVVKYKISRECIESLTIKESNTSGRWAIRLTLTKTVGDNLRKLTQQNLGRKLLIVNGQGNGIGFSSATIQSPLSRKFNLASFASLAQAKASKENILTNHGKCGIVISEK